MEIVRNLPIELRVKIYRRFVNRMAINKNVKNELQRIWFKLFLNRAYNLYQNLQFGQCNDIMSFLLETVKVSKPFPFHKIDESIIDYTDYFLSYTAYPFWTLSFCESKLRYIVKSHMNDLLARSKKSIFDVWRMSNEYHVCGDLEKELIQSIAEIPDITYFMELLNENSKYFDSIKTFVERVKYQLQEMKIDY